MSGKNVEQHESDITGSEGGMPRDLFLVRHGESEGNVALKASDQNDNRYMTPEYRETSAANYRLSTQGREQAAIAGSWIRDWLTEISATSFDRFYCSPFVRTRETAAHLGIPEASWQLEPLLRERDFGLWEGKSDEEIKRDHGESFTQKKRHRFLWRPECGESTPDLDMRVREVLGTLAREMPGQRVLCVTHEDVMWAFRYRLEKMTLEEWLDKRSNKVNRIPNCGILHYTRDDGDSVGGKFLRLRIIDPANPSDARWEEIVRPRFTNEDLLRQVDEYPHLFDNAPATGL